MCPSILAHLISVFRERHPEIEVSILQQNNFKWIGGAEKRAELEIGYLPAESASRPAAVLRSSTIATVAGRRRSGRDVSA